MKYLALISYVVSKGGLSIDMSKVTTTKKWPLLTIVHKVHNYHGLLSFYCHFIPNFNTIMVPITNCVKAEKFLWTTYVNVGFELMKMKLTTTFTCIAIFVLNHLSTL
jgi:hypothetical protein